MPGIYNIPGDRITQTESTSLAILVLTVNAEARAIMLRRIDFAAVTTPAADDVNSCQLMRVTATGAIAGTSVTPEAVDPDDGAADVTCTEEVTVNPTVGNEQFDKPAHRRNSWWERYEDDEAIFCTRTSGNGFLVRSSQIFTGADARAHFRIKQL